LAALISRFVIVSGLRIERFADIPFFQGIPAGVDGQAGRPLGTFSSGRKEFEYDSWLWSFIVLVRKRNRHMALGESDSGPLRTTANERPSGNWMPGACFHPPFLARPSASC